MRLDCRTISAFEQPYSTVVHGAGHGLFDVRRVERPRTPFGRLVSYKVKDAWRKAQIKALRLMPAGMQDRNLEKKYLAIMGASGNAPEVYPGGADGAIAEATKA